MSNLETELKNQGNFPRCWYRYVDDVWVIIKKHNLRHFLNRLNNTKYKTVKFTHEEEVDGKLNFLDLTVIRCNNKFEFDIFRKPTNTGRYITFDSYHPFKHKIAAFHSMIFRAINTPLTEDRLANEMVRIKQIASINGYTEQLINELVNAHKRKRELRDHTTLSLINEENSSLNQSESLVWAGFNYNHEILPKIRPILNRFNIKISECSRGKLMNIIGGSKDKIPAINQSGIYSIKCNCCDKIYIGQSKRAVIKRYKEHRYHTNCNDAEKSSVAKHMIENGHCFDQSGLKLIKRVDDFYKLNAFESFYINKNKNILMNENDGPIRNSIFTKFYD